MNLKMKEYDELKKEMDKNVSSSKNKTNQLSEFKEKLNTNSKILNIIFLK